MIAAIITFCSIGALTSCNDANADNADNDSEKHRTGANFAKLGRRGAARLP